VEPVRLLEFHLGLVEYTLLVDPTWIVTALHELDTDEPEYISASNKVL